MNYDARKNLVKSLRVSRKLEDAQKSKILLKICRDRSINEMEEIEAEDEVQCLPSDIKENLGLLLFCSFGKTLYR